MRLQWRCFLLIFFCFTVETVSIFSQDAPPGALPQSAAGEGVQPEVYAIRNIDFVIKGFTNVNILRYKADIRSGTSFPNKISLERYLAEHRQLLLNERVLAEVEIEYSLVQTGPGAYFVDVTVRTTDSWNIIGLPYFRYDTNDGLLLSLRGRDYNFLGSMQALVVNIDYQNDENGQNSYGGYTFFGVPFRISGHDGGINASQKLSVHADDRPVTSISDLGLWVRFLEPGFPLTLSLAQSLLLNPDEVLNDVDPYFALSSLSLSASIPTRCEVGRLGSIAYNHTLAAYLYWRPDAIVRDDRKGFTAYYAHGVSFGRIDWIKNMRRGLSVSITNTLKHNFLTLVDTLDLDYFMEYHATIGGRLGFNARLVGFSSLTDTKRTDLGTYIRGVKTSRLWGTDVLFATVEAPIKLFDFPTHLVIGKNWFDFELQASPFFDFGYVENGVSAPLADKLWYGSGLEFIVYPLRMRTFIVRASLGLDLDAVIKTKSFTAPSPRDGQSPYEIFFGLGLFF